MTAVPQRCFLSQIGIRLAVDHADLSNVSSPNVSGVSHLREPLLVTVELITDYDHHKVVRQAQL